MKNYIKFLFPFLLLIAGVLTIGSSCTGEPVEEPEGCEEGIQFILDGNLVQFDNSQVTAEIFNDAAIGKFYDIWTDENVSGFNGFYYHSTITETGETAGFAPQWFVTDDVANITFLNDKENVDMTFDIVHGASAVGDHVEINFKGTYMENGNQHTITDGKICTTIDIVH